MMKTPLSTLALALSWCEEDGDLLGSQARPLSLMSLHLLRLMGSRVMEVDPGYADEEGEVRDLTLYDWLHRAPLGEVTDAMWTGGWRAILAAPLPDGETMAAVLPEWREVRARNASLLAATDYEIQPRPRESTSAPAGPQPPLDLLEPTRLTHRIRLLMRETRATRTEALWEWPVWQALQICQAAERWEGRWTVPVRERVPEGTFEEFDLGAND